MTKFPNEQFQSRQPQHQCTYQTLRKHAYSNILKILPPKNEKNSDKSSDISDQNIDYGYSLEPLRRGGF